VIPTHRLNMDDVCAIEFTEALAHLQGLIGSRVLVLVNFHATFGGCSVVGKLTRIDTLPPDDAAVNVLIDDRHGVVLDPEEIDVLLVGDPASWRGWLEFHLPSGVIVQIEAM
jgi:hypothetical protein